MEWPFSRVQKIFFRGRSLWENLWNSSETGWPRFGSVPVSGWNGSSGSGFRFPLSCFSIQFNREGDGSRFGFGSWKKVPTVPVPLSVPGMQDGSNGSSSVPEPPCRKSDLFLPTFRLINLKIQSPKFRIASHSIPLLPLRSTRVATFKWSYEKVEHSPRTLPY